ncbi:hypothetical protein GDO81_011173 [Engystomops pustulosus]|uniref:Uncharacterized protein n=1 Tax=Engystomops pustulosus TaxID=76066 RepID=A0AAV7BCM1_ENGPU|nr:hypothetical protein GDO81_011173 [Engystomops pustulosus]
MTTLRSSSTISVTSSTRLENGTEIKSLELRMTKTIYVEVKTISPNTVVTNISSSFTSNHSGITMISGLPMTFTNSPESQRTENVTVTPNQQLFQPNLCSSKPSQTKTTTQTITVGKANFASTTTTTTVTTEQVIVIV